jgi:hypothetical protein
MLSSRRHRVSEALITTEFSLFVGIPALGTHHYLRGKVEWLLHEGLPLELLNAGPYLWSVGVTGAEALGMVFPEILTAADGS